MIKLIKKLFRRLTQKRLFVYNSKFLGGWETVKLSEQEVLDEVTKWALRKGVNYVIKEGVLHTKDKKKPNGLGVHYFYLGSDSLFYIFPDSFRCSHSNIGSLQNTLKILEPEIDRLKSVDK